MNGKTPRQTGETDSAGMARSSTSPSREPPRGTDTGNQQALTMRQPARPPFSEWARQVSGSSGESRTLSQPGDPEELEADREADAFISGSTHAGLCTSCPESGETMRSVDGGSATSSVQGSAAPSGPGHALDADIRQPYEQFFRTDFRGVRIHDDARAAEAASGLDARAYQQGAHIVFGDGEFSPTSASGRRLLAHELAHVAQRARGSSSGRIFRQPTQLTNPILTPDEMLGIVTRERSWAFNRGGGQLVEDPAGVGRGVGAAAGGRRAGFSVFAVIQVTDADGRPAALTYGDHVSYGDPHAEQRAILALDREIPIERDLQGGRMTVVLDQIPCPPGRADCMGNLNRWAQRRGVQLEIHVPTRERVDGLGNVSPRTAAMSSMRTDTPPVQLVRINPDGTPAPVIGGGGGPGHGPGPGPGAAGGADFMPPTGATPHATGPFRMTGPTPSTPGATQMRAKLMVQLSNQAERGVRLNARIAGYVQVLGGLMSALDMLETLKTMQTMYVHGTMFHEVEAQVDAVGNYGREMQEWSDEVTDEISLFQIIVAIDEADRRNDRDTLFDISSSIDVTAKQLHQHADRFRDTAMDLRAREAALDKLVPLYELMVKTPTGPSTAPNAQAFAMYESLDRLSGHMGSAAAPFEAADQQLRAFAEGLDGLSMSAHDKAWAINWMNMAIAVKEADRIRQLDETLNRERRLNELGDMIRQIDSAFESQCYTSTVLFQMQLRRAFLVQERDKLTGASSSP